MENGHFSREVFPPNSVAQGVFECRGRLRLLAGGYLQSDHPCVECTIRAGRMYLRKTIRNSLKEFIPAVVENMLMVG